MSARSSDSSLAPYAAMVRLGEQQLEVARQGELGGLEPLEQAWQALVADAPPEPPAAAAAALEAAAALSGQTTAQLKRMQEALLCDIAVTARASKAARGYAARARYSSRVDRSA
jgi:hypothetical protein